MSDQHFRQAYDALMERMPDPPPFEAIASTPLASSTRDGWRPRVGVIAAALIALVGFVGLALLIAPDEGDTSVPPGGSVDCEMPPESELTVPDSDFTLTVTPNPVSPGGQVELTISSARAPSGDAITGAVAELQCWDGTSWVDTHWLFKDGFGSGPVAVEPDVTITFPAVGLLIDEPHTIVMPDLTPGLYRVEDQVLVGSVNRPVYALVEVAEDAPSATTAPTGPTDSSVTTSLPVPTTEPTTEDVLPSDRAVVDAFLQFAQESDSVTFSRLPLADSVSLGLGPQIINSVEAESLLDAEAWILDVEVFRAHTGPFSALELLRTLEGHSVQVGEHPHCAGPPQPPPSGLADLRRVSIQPPAKSIDTCLDWMTVDFFVDESGQVRAITMDVWEP